MFVGKMCRYLLHGIWLRTEGRHQLPATVHREAEEAGGVSSLFFTSLVTLGRVRLPVFNLQKEGDGNAPFTRLL